MSEDTEESQSIHEVTRLEDQDDDKEKEYSKGEYMYLFFANSYKVEGTSWNRASGHTQTTCVQCTWHGDLIWDGGGVQTRAMHKLFSESVCPISTLKNTVTLNCR